MPHFCPLRKLFPFINVFCSYKILKNILFFRKKKYQIKQKELKITTFIALEITLLFFFFWNKDQISSMKPREQIALQKTESMRAVFQK